MVKSSDSFSIIQILNRYQVDFIVVGMTAGVLQGVQAMTFDVDIIYRISEGNAEKLLMALVELEAEFRSDISNRKLRPNASHLMSAGHKLLMTKYGMLDVLGTIEENTRYEDLEGDVMTVQTDGIAIPVLRLERLIEAKARTGRPKDQAVLPLLQAALAVIRKG